MENEWDWSKVKGDRYDIPAREMYFVLARWKEEGFKHILDLGCGKGRHSVLFAENGFKVTAVDISDSVLTEIEKKKKRNKLNINAIKADMFKLPFEDNSFDGVIAYNVISHTDSRGIIKVINELSRVVRNEGELFLTFCSKESLHYRNPLARIDANTIIKNVTGPEEGIPHYYCDKEGLEHLLMGLKIEDMVHSCDYIHNGKKMKDCFHYFVLCSKSSNA